MTTGAARQRTASQLALVGGTLGVLAGAAQAAFGSRTTDWTGNKANPVALGLLTIVLSFAALGAASRLRASTSLPPRVRTAIAIVLLASGGLCFSTVGRLWYIPGIVMFGAFGFTLAAGGTSELGAVIRSNWTRGLVSLLGSFEMLMAVSAGPVITIIVGIIGGIALMIAPWLGGPARMASALLLFIGTVPFAAITWWSLVSPLLAVVALAIGLRLLAAPASPRSAPPGTGAHSLQLSDQR